MFGQGILRTVRLVIVATPPLLLVSAVTLGLALRPHRATPPPPPAPIVTDTSFDVMRRAPTPPCVGAHALLVVGHVTGGATHMKLAGPVIYTDVTTNSLGNFELRIPVDGDVCSVLPSAQQFQFDGDGMSVTYTIGFER